MFKQTKHDYDLIILTTKDSSLPRHITMPEKPTKAKTKAKNKTKTKIITSPATFIDKNTIKVGDKTMTATYFLIATGLTQSIKDIKIDPKVTLVSQADFAKQPKTLPLRTTFIIGAGKEGIEAAQFFTRLGRKVFIADISNRLLPGEDEEVGQLLDKIFNKKGLTVLTQTRVLKIEKKPTGIRKQVYIMQAGETKSLQVDDIVNTTGYLPNFPKNLDKLSVKTNKKGIITSKTGQTSISNIYAIGQIVDKHRTKEEEAAELKVVLHNIFSRKKLDIDITGFPTITYASPTVARAGLTEELCEKQALKTKKLIAPTTKGFIKLLVDQKTDQILGATIVGNSADEAIGQLATLIKLEVCASDLEYLPYADATFSAYLKDLAE